MTPENSPEKWNSSEPYEYFMGRWSKRVAPEFLKWLHILHNKSWLDLGCGTGVLSEAIFRYFKPTFLCCVDPSEEFLEKAKEKVPTAEFLKGVASAIPVSGNTFDIVVSGLALNFFPDLTSAFSEMKRVVNTNGIIAAYVWDYAGRMDLLRYFWNAAREVDAEAIKLDEGTRFPICNAEKLKESFQREGLTNIETTSLDVMTVFNNFDDYWKPFLGKQGPAPGYLNSLSEDFQNEIKNRLVRKLQAEKDGSIKLLARAIAVKGMFIK